MGCNFNAAAAIRLMIKYELNIMAVQEHIPWNRTLSDMEKSSIERTCNKYGFFVTISKLQIIIIDKQLSACHRETTIYEEGRIIKTRLEISSGNYVTFLPVYGVPHFSGNRNHQDPNENTKLQTMQSVQDQLRLLATKALCDNDLIYIFGDLQDTPDMSKNFHYGSNRIAKHPLGIIATCESINLECTIYHHWDAMEKPIISRHGSKGGRFIDGMYTSSKGLSHVLGITIIKDTGIYSDHDLVISKIDLGIKKFDISNDKEERIDFRSIMNIPVAISPEHDHPTLNTKVYKGREFKLQKELFDRIQDVAHDPKLRFIDQIGEVELELKELEKRIIDKTKATMSPSKQAEGKLLFL